MPRSQTVNGTHTGADGQFNGAVARMIPSGSKFWIRGVAFIISYVAVDWISYLHPISALGLTPWNPPPSLSFALIMRDIVACYDATVGGYFRPHRDNSTKGTEHRRFAVSINLNSEDYKGGNLRFPEFGSREYRPPTGGAVVFSCSLLHEATPITKGRRYAYLPFLYDDDAAALRARNNIHLGNGVAAYHASPPAQVPPTQ